MYYIFIACFCDEFIFIKENIHILGEFIPLLFIDIDSSYGEEKDMWEREKGNDVVKGLGRI